MRSFLRLLAALLVLGVVGAGVAFWYGRRAYDAPGPLARQADVVVPHGGTRAVGRALARQGVIASPLLFDAAALLTMRDGQIHAAELAFAAHASLREVLAVLRHGKPVQHELTIPEGLTAAQIAELLNRDPLLDGKVGPPTEGAVLPQTYAYERGTSRAALLERMKSAMDKALAKVWAERDPNLRLPDSWSLLILASIVERETGVADERKLVAQVFLNRLRQDMRLQSDPTVAYAITQGAKPLPALTRADLTTDSPYNTYLNQGLPPGPICSPGLAALQAVAHPASGQALYFVATGNGGHAFADTLPQHEAHVAQYRAVMAARAGGNPAELPVPSQGLLSSDQPGAEVSAGTAGPVLPPFQPGVAPPAEPTRKAPGHAPAHRRIRHHRHPDGSG